MGNSFPKFGLVKVKKVITLMILV